MSLDTDLSEAPNAIAVIGMAGRFPGAGSVDAFWENLCRGEESIVSLSDDELRTAGVDASTLDDPAYVRRAALMDGIDEFDTDFFGFTASAARTMDPQHRLFLQCAWHAFEDSGYDPASYGGAIGVYGTSSASGYLLYNLMSHRDIKSVIGEGATFEMVNLSLSNDKDHLATRAAHQFDLRGPSLSVQTACSSSLVAVHLACQSLLSGECEMVLAGAASIRVPHRVGYWYQPGAMVSSVGHCRPFDVRADGTIFGSGVAAVVLKPLHAALDDGDRIHAVIRGSAINNDGSTKMTYAAPNAAGQAAAIAEAHAVAGVDAATIGFVETHGTGTPLGDPIEIEGLRQAFELSSTTRPEPCVLGSVKSNIGHLETASGITGLVKAILCVKHGAIPPTLHYTAPNPELHLDRTPFVVQNRYAPWESAGPRRAGVSSFGVGGTNAHVVIEEAPTQAATTPAPGPQVLLLSAGTPDSLQAARARLADALSAEQAPPLPDVAFTLAGRRPAQLRMAAVVHDHADAVAALRVAEHDNVSVGERKADVEPGLAFLFPGQGAQHVGMAAGLYDDEPVFRREFDRCATGFAEELGIDLRTEVFEGSGLERTDLAQPALFAVEYALAQLVMSYGVTPSALAGHSIGELVAATVAGVFDLPSALKVVAMRARLMHGAPAGTMVAVANGPEHIAAHLTDDVDLAAVNDPGSCVVAGSEESIRDLTERLTAQGILARRVRTSHAFHSRSMDTVLPSFAKYLATVTLNPPRIPLLSNITGIAMTDQEATDPDRWARHIRATVRFGDQLGVLLTDPHRVLVEVGPGGSLTGSAVRARGWSDTHRAVRMMRHPLQSRADRDAFLLGLGQLWSAGVDVDWTPLHGEREPQRVTLPGYSFAAQRHWIEPAQAARRSVPAADDSAPDVAAGNQADATDARSAMQATLQRIWSQCLGVNTVAPGDNFFELGGDSLLAIGVAMTAANEGVELTPQDLYDHHTLAGLADTLVARHASGGLSGEPNAELNPPLPPNLWRFLDRGLAEPGRWRAPLIFRVDERVSADDVRLAVTAVVNHHDALRMRIAERFGSWEQQIAEPIESIDLGERSLPADAATESAQEQKALSDIVSETLAGQDLTAWPVTVTYVTDAEGSPRFLVLTVHQTVDDAVSREVLVTDLLTAFTQRLAGEDIALEPVGTSWGDWSQRCAALAAHPAVLDRRDFWIDNAARTTLRLADPAVAGPPSTAESTRLGRELTLELTSLIDNARRVSQSTMTQILLAALARTIAGTVGDGVVAVDVTGAGRSVLKPDVDLRRTVGWFSTVHPVALSCMDVSGASAEQLLEEVGRSVEGVPHHGIGHDLLRYLHAPTAQILGGAGGSDVFFNHLGTLPEFGPSDAPVQLDGRPATAALTVTHTPPGLGHPVELRVYRSAGVLHVDWWYDRRRVSGSMIEALADRFPSVLTELIAGIGAADDDEDDDEALTLVDLSATVFSDDD